MRARLVIFFGCVLAMFLLPSAVRASDGQDRLVTGRAIDHVE